MNVDPVDVLRRILSKPYGCRFCDSGKLRIPDNPAKDHDDDCGFMLAAKVVALDDETRAAEDEAGVLRCRVCDEVRDPIDGCPNGHLREASSVSAAGAPPLSELVTCSLRDPDQVVHLPRLDCQHEAPHLIAACGAFRESPSSSGTEGASLSEHPIWRLANRLEASLRAIRQSRSLDHAKDIAGGALWTTAEIRGVVAKLVPGPAPAPPETTKND